MANNNSKTKVITGMNTRLSYFHGCQEHQRRLSEVQRIPHHSEE